MSGAQQKAISFEELVSGRDANVRVTEDKMIYAVDLVMVITGNLSFLDKGLIVLFGPDQKPDCSLWS